MNHTPERIFASNVTNFEETCLEWFDHQYQHNQVYRNWCSYLQMATPTKVSEIPFLPVEFFKHHEVKAFSGNPEKEFYSSSTGGIGASKHLVKSLSIYVQSLHKGFTDRFGPLEGKCILGLLPSYLEREGSSLVYMVQYLMQHSGHPLNGFFLYEREGLIKRLQQLEDRNEHYLLFGVSFALLDLCKSMQFPLTHATIIETGGMKGRRKEITRMELLGELEAGLGATHLYSEYGMTEMLSQAYADRHGRYNCPPWMKVRMLDINDPFAEVPTGKTGRIGVIDLANYYSCSFLLTSDLGRKHEDGTFEVLGRLDNSDIRGCSLLAGSF